jgi:hypothetical protein
MEEEAEEPEEGSEDEKKRYRLKCLQKMREKTTKYWNVLLAPLMPST